jgi:hypothetical protein
MNESRIALIGRQIAERWVIRNVGFEESLSIAMIGEKLL